MRFVRMLLINGEKQNNSMIIVSSRTTHIQNSIIRAYNPASKFFTTRNTEMIGIYIAVFCFRF